MLDTNSTATTLTTPPDEAEQPIAPPGKKRWFARHRFALGGILLISIVMNFYALGKNGFGSYYPAAIRSMLDNWHNFFFVSYDPGGFVSIDKPPVGFWLEAASAKIFGFNSVSILLPQALAGVLSVWLLYYLVRRHFGVVAGLLAALALALNPISILTNRNVTIDSTLTLVLLLGAWTVLKAAETGRLRWLLLTAFIVGIGFNIPRIAQRDRACSKRVENVPPYEGRIAIFPNKEVDMSSIVDSSVIIQTSSESVPSPPGWLGEVVLLVEHLRKQGVLAAIEERVRFARRRFGHYEVIDFLAVLFGYAISGERTLEAFYERLAPFDEAFMALFNRERLPSRSALSRFLASFTPAAVEALRVLFLEDLLTRSLTKERQRGELLDRAGGQWEVFDIDGTREAARQRALPKTEDLPPAQRRLDEICAAGYTGRKRGEVVRTRTVVSQAHTSQWLSSFGNRGNGEYRKDLASALGVIRRYLEALGLPQERALLRLDGLYGTGAVIADLKGLCFVMRGKDYTVLDHPTVQARLHLPPDAHFSRPESILVRTLYDCPDVPVGPEGCRCRVVVATHPATEKKSRIGHTRKGVVYELFFTQLPQEGFTASDVVALYLHRGAFEPLLADEDVEQEPDRWCSHSPAGQDAWQVVSQWVWNLRLELGHVLEPTPLRTTEFAPAIPPVTETRAKPAPAQGYDTPSVAAPWKTGRFSGQDFAFQPDGTLRCPAHQALVAHEQRREADGSLRVVYTASIRSCRPCPLRHQCQWEGSATKKPRQVSVLLHPLQVGPAPLLWRDWSRREHRRACMQLLRHQRIEVSMPPPAAASPPKADVILSRAQRAHSRLSWAERLARNARVPTASQVTIKLFGVPEGFATSLGLARA